MIKRFLAFIILGIFITFKCFTWVPVAAVSVIPPINALEYTILQTIAMATQNGAEIDFTGSLADIIHDVNVGTYSVEYGLKELLKRYAVKAWDQIVFDLNDPNNLNFLISGISFASGVSLSSLNNIIKQYNNKVLDNSIDVVTPINDKDIAFWNKYKTLYINKYLELMNYATNQTPDPDISYLSDIDIINGSGFYWSDWSQQDWYVYSLSGCSWYRITPTDNITNSISNNVYGSIIENVYITSSGETYTFSLTPLTSSIFQDTNDTTKICNRGTINSQNQYISRYSSQLYTLPTYSKTGTLTDVFNYLKANIRNVNIYVDGILWARAGSVIDQDFNVSVPNGVIDNSSDDGKIVSNPIYWVVDSNTGNPIDAQINLDVLANIIKSMIDGTRSDTTIGFDDLVDAGAIEKTDGTTITDSEIGTKSISDVIADATSITGDISITGEIAGVIPPLPILPNFTAGPKGDPLAGFKGMSVLARIVNVTNRGLPEDIIAMFYGIVATLIVLGIIKILHK